MSKYAAHTFAITVAMVLITLFINWSIREKEQSRVIRTQCSAKGGTYFNKEGKCLDIKEIKL